LSVRKQCELLSLNRSSYYYSAVEEKIEDLLLKRLIDEEYTRHPFLGSRRMTIYLRSLQHEVNRKRVQRLMQEMGLEAIYVSVK
jgi:putative transposase